MNPLKEKEEKRNRKEEREKSKKAKRKPTTTCPATPLSDRGLRTLHCEMKSGKGVQSTALKNLGEYDTIRIIFQAVTGLMPCCKGGALK